MAARPVAGDFLRDSLPQLTPTISPVDIFQPAQQRPSQTEGFLNALSNLDQQLRPTLQKSFDKAVTKEDAEGVALFEKNRVDFKEAVRSGVIPAGASPYVRKGFRRAELNTLGASYATQLARALETSDLHKTEDPAAMEQFMGDFFEQFSETNGIEGYDKQELAEHFIPNTQRANNMFRQRHSEKNIAFVEQQRFEAFDQEVFATLDMQDFGGSFSEVQSAVTDTTEFMMAKVAELESEGLDRTLINQRVVDAIITSAVEREDTDVIDVLRNMQIGTGPLSNTKYAREKIAAAEDQIERMRLAKISAARTAAAAERTAFKESLEQEAGLALLSGDQATFEAARAKLAEVDAMAVIALDAKAASRENTEDDRQTREQFSQVRTIMDGVKSREEALQVLNEFPHISTGERDRLLDEVTARLENPALNSWLSTGAINQARSALRSEIDSSTDFAFNGEDKIRANDAVADLDSALLKFYREKDGKFAPGEDIEFAQKQVRLLRETYKKQEESTVDLSAPKTGAQSVPENKPGFIGRIFQNGFFNEGVPDL